MRTQHGFLDSSSNHSSPSQHFNYESLGSGGGSSMGGRGTYAGGVTRNNSYTNFTNNNNNNSTKNAVNTSNNSRGNTNNKSNRHRSETAPPIQNRRRTYSWKGEETIDPQPIRREHSWDSLLPLIALEARAVSLWAISSAMFRLVVSVVIEVASYQDTWEKQNHDQTEWIQQILIVPSVLCGWLLRLIVPLKVISGNAPGFLYASVWLLLWVQQKCGIIPHVTSRICEMLLGRITVQELAALLPTHFVCAISTSMILDIILPKKLSSMALDPILYSTEGSPLFKDFVHEMFINAVFTIGILVLPAILRLNKIPRWFTLLIMYPIYSYSVDSQGKGSTFAPNILFALPLSIQRHSKTPQFWRILAQCLGGYASGKIMQVFFPDNDP